jgi:hypothetical protein
MPIQMFNWMSRPEAAFQENAAAAGLVLVMMTLSMNGVAIWLRYATARTSNGERLRERHVKQSPIAGPRSPAETAQDQGGGNALHFYYGDFQALKNIDMPI